MYDNRIWDRCPSRNSPNDGEIHDGKLSWKQRYDNHKDWCLIGERELALSWICIRDKPQRDALNQVRQELISWIRHCSTIFDEANFRRTMRTYIRYDSKRQLYNFIIHLPFMIATPTAIFLSRHAEVIGRIHINWQKSNESLTWCTKISAVTSTKMILRCL